MRNIEGRGNQKSMIIEEEGKKVKEVSWGIYWRRKVGLVTFHEEDEKLKHMTMVRDRKKGKKVGNIEERRNLKNVIIEEGKRKVKEVSWRKYWRREIGLVTFHEEEEKLKNTIMVRNGKKEVSQKSWKHWRKEKPEKHNWRGGKKKKLKEVSWGIYWRREVDWLHLMMKRRN